MDRGHVSALVVKDLREIFSSIAIYGPMIAIPLFFAFTLPAFTVYISKYAGPRLASRLVGAVVTGVSAQDSLYFVRFFSVNILGPIFLTMPIITASVIAADSFAGEKERKTAESLLATPITNAEVLLGKLLASFLPAIVMTIFVFLIYAGVTDYLSLGAFGSAIFPNESWYLMLLNAPFLALTTIGLVVIVSSRVKGIKEAQQISTLLVLPILIIPFISVFNISSLTAGFFIGMLGVLIISAVVVITIGVKIFDREGFITV